METESHSKERGAHNRHRQRQRQRQWSQLPIELLELISKKTTDILDYIRFGAVCSSWQSATANPTTGPLKSRLPWLLLPYKPEACPTRYSFYSLSHDRVFTLDLPQLVNKAVVTGSDCGWLVVLDKACALSLLNPITRSQIRLPPTANSWLSLTGCYSFGIQAAGCWRVALFSNPGDGTVVTVTNPGYTSKKFGFCRVGDEAWTLVDSFLPGTASSVVYHNRRIYAIDSMGNCVVVNADGARVRLLSSLTPPPKLVYNGPPRPELIEKNYGEPIVKFYIIKIQKNAQLGDEELVLLLMNNQYPEDWSRPVHVNVMRMHRLQMGGENKEVVEWSDQPVESIGDCTLFLSPFNSCSAICARAPTSAQCKPNSMYLNEARIYINYVMRIPAMAVHVFDMDSSKFLEPLPISSWRMSNGDFSGEWFVPTLC